MFIVLFLTKNTKICMVIRPCRKKYFHETKNNAWLILCLILSWTVEGYFEVGVKMNVRNGLYRVKATISMQRMFSLLFVAFMWIPFLNARWIHIDAGIGSNITVISFPIENNNRIEGLTGSSFSYITGPNFRFSLGLRPSNRVVFPLLEYQIMPINKDFYYKGRVLSLLPPYRINDYRLNIRRHEYIGAGFIVHPYQRIQIGASLGNVFSHYTREIKSEDSVNGIAFFINLATNISIAYDIPINNFGLLIGGRYFSAHVHEFTTLWMIPHPSYEVSAFGIFTKIRI